MKSNYLRLVMFLSQAKKETTVKVGIGITIIAIGFAQAMLIANLIGSIIAKSDSTTILKHIIVIAIVITLKSIVIRYQEGYNKKMAAKIKSIIREKLLDKLMQLGPSYQSKNRSGNIQSLITDGVEAFETYLTNYIPHTIVVLITISSAIIYLLNIDISVAIIIMSMGLLSVLIPHLFMPSISKIMIEYWQTYANLNSQYIDFMQGMTTLKTFDASKKIGERLSQDTHEFAKESIKNTGLSLADSACIIICTMLGTALPVIVAIMHMSQGEINYSQLLIILFLSAECMKPFYELNLYWHGSYLGFSVAEELYKILDEKIITQIDKDQNSVQNISSKPSLTLENVSFKYEVNTNPVLENLDMEIKSGQVTAIVGESGCGKSTIVNLLLRFFEIESGNIKIDGVDIKKYSTTYLRQQIAVVFQDTYLFYGTIKENINLANPNASEEEIINAAKAANAHDFIMQFPKGYDTLVGERGATLSGGQKQRISIARAVLKNAPILILDEATSNVDVVSEKAIQIALEKLMKNRTTIVIAHRLSTIENADKVYTLKAGEAI